MNAIYNLQLRGCHTISYSIYFVKIDEFTILTAHLLFSMKVHYARDFFPLRIFREGGAESICILKWGQILRGGSTKQNYQFMLSKKKGICLKY